MNISFPARASWGLLAAALSAASPAEAVPVSVEDAIRAAWAGHLGLRAALHQATAARADADAADHGWLPTLALEAKAVRTDEPLMAFGIRLDQGVVTQGDFAPARLNHPDGQTAVGASLSVTQPIYAGGRISAGRRATAAAAAGATASFEARRQELALAVVQAYFGAEAAEEGLRYADDLMAQSRETERFVRARNGQGLALDADVARATAFRAQAEAERTVAQERVETARSALALLSGDDARHAALTTPLEAAAGPPPLGTDPAARPSLQAVRLQRDAAEAGAELARGSLLPSVGARATIETLRTAGLGDGNTWYSVGLSARWDLSLGDADRARAARARAAAAADALAWEERWAHREVEDARRSIGSAEARAGSAREAMTSSESALKLRRARHEQGLLPLTDVLDVQTALAGARALAVQARLEVRTARARLAVALGQNVEGVSP